MKPKETLFKGKNREHLTKSKSKKCLVVNLKKHEQGQKHINNKLVKKRKKNTCKSPQVDDNERI